MHEFHCPKCGAEHFLEEDYLFSSKKVQEKIRRWRKKNKAPSPKFNKIRKNIRKTIVRTSENQF